MSLHGIRLKLLTAVYDLTYLIFTGAKPLASHTNGALNSPQPEDVELHILHKTASPEESMWFVGETNVYQLETELRENPS